MDTCSLKTNKVRKVGNRGLICGACMCRESRCLPLLVILVFGAVFEDARELCVVEVALLVDRRLAEELVHLFVREAVAHGGQQLPQLVLMDHT